ncbi:putative quinol monooxygenase [Runella rosea]|nr:putative quinol monooxygenase [Runella rosea]
MKILKSSICALLLMGMSLFESVAQNKPNEGKITVFIKYKTQPSKEDMALKALQELIAKVKKEPHYVSIVLHVDPNDKSNILLYEQWADEDYYKGAHMKTAHLLQFINDSRQFLAGPPDISFWKAQNLH